MQNREDIEAEIIALEAVRKRVITEPNRPFSNTQNDLAIRAQVTILKAVKDGHGHVQAYDNEAHGKNVTIEENGWVAVRWLEGLETEAPSIGWGRIADHIESKQVMIVASEY
jgi:hypothetical protein